MFNDTVFLLRIDSIKRITMKIMSYSSGCRLLCRAPHWFEESARENHNGERTEFAHWTFHDVVGVSGFQFGKVGLAFP